MNHLYHLHSLRGRMPLILKVNGLGTIETTLVRVNQLDWRETPTPFDGRDEKPTLLTPTLLDIEQVLVTRSLSLGPEPGSPGLS